MPIRDKQKWNEWNKNRNDKNKIAIEEMKSNPCTDCKKCFPAYVMEYDHVPERGKRKFSISGLSNRSIKAPSFIAELAKCDLVCANCHKVRTHTRGQNKGASLEARAKAKEKLETVNIKRAIDKKFPLKKFKSR